MILSILRLAALAVAGLFAVTGINAAELATATISGTEISPGEFQYSLTLNDAGTTPLGTFWFAWTSQPTFDNFMPVSPTDITSAAGWQEEVTHGGPSDGYAIQWTAMTASEDLAAGGTLTGFSFDSSLSLAQLGSPASGTPSEPVATSFVYAGTPLSDAGLRFVVEPITAAPEPANLLLCTCGFAALLLVFRRRLLTASHNS